MNVYGVSKTSLYRSRNKFLDAVLNCDGFKITFPDSEEDLKQVSEDFMLKSSNELIKGCVGAIDGFFQPIINAQHLLNVMVIKKHIFLVITSNMG